MLMVAMSVFPLAVSDAWSNVHAVLPFVEEIPRGVEPVGVGNGVAW